MSENHLLGLSNQSRQIIDYFYRWSKLSLEKFKNDLLVELSSFVTGNLLHDRMSYSKEDVNRILQGQSCMLQGLIDAQVNSTTTAASELMRAMLHEADRQRVLLQVDPAAVLSNVSGIQAMGQHWEQLLGGPSGRLAPLTVETAGGEAGRQLVEANNEVRQLKQKLQQVTDAYTKVMNSRSDATSRLLSLQDAIQRKDLLAKDLAQRCQGQENLQKEIQKLQLEVSETKKELVTRLNQSTQYQQLKQLLTQRNAQIKELRRRLCEYDPSLRNIAEDDIAPEDN